MNRRTLLAGAAALAATPALLRPAQAQAGRIQLQWWHSMSGALADALVALCDGFNASQGEYQVVPSFKGGYADSMAANIAAWRADQAPHLAQVFEVGTATMIAAGPAVKQIWQLSQETGVVLDPARYIAGVRGYYSLTDGRLASMPFNSSTTVLYWNKDAFAKAGLDPEKPPVTWAEVLQFAAALKAKEATPIPVSTSWPTWIHFEQFGALHDIPIATLSNGFGGLDTELTINRPEYVMQLNRLLQMSKDGLFKYAGRDNTPDQLFPSGQAAIFWNSSGNRADNTRLAKFAWGEGFMPFDDTLIKQPNNSIIGGASLWPMTGKTRTAAEYKGVALFLAYLATPENAAAWHQKTGYVSVTNAGYELSRTQGFYEKNPGADIPLRQLTQGKLTENSKGLRLGRLPEIRTIMYEEIEKALQGQQDAKTALDTARERGNRVLREFQRSVRG